MTYAGAPKDIRILLVEDHQVLLDGTRPLLEAAPGLTVVGATGHAPEAARLAKHLRPDVVLLDLFLAGESSGLDVARCLVRADPHPAILVLTGVEDMEIARAALQLGIRGYLYKTVRMAELIAATKRVHAGDIVLDPKVEAALAAPRARGRQAGLLTERQRTTMQLLGQGLSNAAIAERLVIAERTVEWHVEQLKQKLDLPSRAALIANAARSEPGVGQAERPAEHRQ